MSSNLFWSRKVDKSLKYCVYVVLCYDRSLPHFYIGKSSVRRIVEENYHGSLRSKSYADRWHDLVRTNPESFRRKVIFTTDSEEEALAKEDEILRHFEAPSSPLFANKSFANGFKGCQNKGRKQSPEIVRKRTESLVRNGKLKGRRHSEETKAKMSKTRTGKEFIEKRVKSKLVSPDGTVFEFQGIYKFAALHGLNGSHLCQVLKGKADHYKGWRRF